MKDSSQKFRQIDVSCWAKEHKTDDPLGQGKVDIADTLRTGEFDGERRSFLINNSMNISHMYPLTRLGEARSERCSAGGDVSGNNVLLKCTRPGTNDIQPCCSCNR